MGRKYFYICVLLLVTVFGAFMTSCTTDDDEATLLDVAVSTETLESLVNVVTFIDENATGDPGLASTLDDEGLNITLFAPGNDALIAVFGDIDSDGVVELEDLLDFADAEFAGNTTAAADFLFDVVAYHLVIGTAYDSADVIALIGDPAGVETLAGVDLLVTQPGADIILDPADGTSEAALTSTLDIQASNGIAHVISSVLGLPVVM